HYSCRNRRATGRECSEREKERASSDCCRIPRMPRKPKPAADDDRLSEVARTIGSTLGTAKVRAGQVVEGIKAAAKAGADAYAGSAGATSTRKPKSSRRSPKPRRRARKK